MRRLLLGLAAWLLAASLASAKPADAPYIFNRSPHHFTIRHGLADSTRDADAHAFLHPHVGTTTIAGSFSVRQWHDRQVRVEAVFFKPELTLAAVTIVRPAGWTLADRAALLSDYGRNWRHLSETTSISAEGVWAVYLNGAFHLLSPYVVGKMDAQVAAAEADAKAGKAP